ncbi:MAG: DinB family protein [Dehalococcoidia bacterium]
MTATQSIMSALESNWRMVDSALDGLDEALLNRRPGSQTNSISWILWHMNRVMDIFIQTRLHGKPQIWIEKGWYREFGMNDDPDLRGVGWTAEQVSEWEAPSREVQLGYYKAVQAGAREVIPALSAEDLADRNNKGVQLGGGKVMPPPKERRSVAEALGVMVWDNIAHGGQIAYLRGLYGGMGWHS